MSTISHIPERVNGMDNPNEHSGSETPLIERVEMAAGLGSVAIGSVLTSVLIAKPELRSFGEAVAATATSCVVSAGLFIDYTRRVFKRMER